MFKIECFIHLFFVSLSALVKAKQNGISAEGPIPADVLFHQAYLKKYNAVIAMYHDQGLIPLKMLAFDKGVNITIGLPIIRTSPCHGTAFDIAGKGIANPSSLIEAIKMAIFLANNCEETRCPNISL